MLPRLRKQWAGGRRSPWREPAIPGCSRQGERRPPAHCFRSLGNIRDNIHSLRSAKSSKSASGFVLWVCQGSRDFVHAPVSNEGLARNKSGVLTRQEEDRADDVVRLGKTLDRLLHPSPFLQVGWNVA